jgi:hypothetical protein
MLQANRAVNTKSLTAKTPAPHPQPECQISAASPSPRHKQPAHVPSVPSKFTKVKKVTVWEALDPARASSTADRTNSTTRNREGRMTISFGVRSSGGEPSVGETLRCEGNPTPPARIEQCIGFHKRGTTALLGIACCSSTCRSELSRSQSQWSHRPGRWPVSPWLRRL